MYLLSGGRVPAGHHRLPTQRLQGELGSAGLGWGWGWSCLLGADREGLVCLEFLPGISPLA